ncbi:endonuclease IV (plasmid) [Thermus oshimai JL-2]|uniref:Endonuclease IV n=1 Tax=Thermus oshimai JL-2 TaxID=751945 RepID=K7QWV0_THEOS|nr:TIM barrel protein [Thermus oshimai]AFV77331.1 endonuclease IV [Thermus oshimai JL-2]
MRLLWSVNLLEAEALLPRLEALGLGAEVYLDPRGLGDRALLERLARRLPRPLSAHLPFWNLDPIAPDPEVANLSRRRLLEGLEAAARLGAGRAVFHSGLPAKTPLEGALARVEPLLEALRPLVERARALGVALFLENTHEPAPGALVELLEALGLGFCFDPAHARVFSATPDPFSWLALRPGHLHLNGTDGVYDRHWNLDRGEGDLAWLEGLEGVPWVLEVRGDPEPSLRFLADRLLTAGG